MQGAQGPDSKNCRYPSISHAEDVDIEAVAVAAGTEIVLFLKGIMTVGIYGVEHQVIAGCDGRLGLQVPVGIGYNMGLAVGIVIYFHYLQCLRVEGGSEAAAVGPGGSEAQHVRSVITIGTKHLN